MTTRITGGTHRGRVLRTPTVSGLRPTSERVRAAVFSIIGPDAVAGRRLADLYAGTGALGLDALSRGAAWVDFVEHSGKLCAALKERLRFWALDERSGVYRGRVVQVLDKLPGGYDVVMADPPYASDELADLIGRLQSSRLVNRGGLVVLEHRSGDTTEFEAGRFSLETTREYGDTTITVLRAGAADG